MIKLIYLLGWMTAIMLVVIILALITLAALFAVEEIKYKFNKDNQNN